MIRRERSGQHMVSLPSITFHDILDMKSPLLMVVMRDLQSAIIGYNRGVDYQ